VAPLAVLAQLALVLVRVAVDTAELSCTVDAARVAQLTVVPDLGVAMETDQWKTRVLVVIEGQLAFAAFHVAIRARRVVVLAVVRVLVFVAVGAGAFPVAQLGIGPMALHTRNLRMLTEEIKSKLGMFDVRALE
jgi:hypothetical protein